ncbi:MAG: hypothetical protein ACI4Q6_08925, partial [Huintestinicola sp.]
LKRAMLFGTAALIWSIPSLNILGIIAAIITWIAYSSHRKGASETAGMLYIAASVLSIAFVAFMQTVTLFMIIRSEFWDILMIDMVIGVVLYILAAVNCMKGAKTLKESGGEKNSFFD